VGHFEENFASRGFALRFKESRNYVDGGEIAWRGICSKGSPCSGIFHPIVYTGFSQGLTNLPWLLIFKLTYIVYHGIKIHKRAN
jgi:hypothetical protein